MLFSPGLFREYSMSCHFEMGEVSQVLSSFGCDRCHTALFAVLLPTLKVRGNRVEASSTPTQCAAGFARRLRGLRTSEALFPLL